MVSRAQEGANSDVYRAAATANGTAIKIAMIVTLNVPMKSGSSEYFGVSEIGCQLNSAAFPACTCWGRNSFDRLASA